MKWGKRGGTVKVIFNTFVLYGTQIGFDYFKNPPVSAGRDLSYRRSVVNLLYPVADSSKRLSKKPASKPISTFDVVSHINLLFAKTLFRIPHFLHMDILHIHLVYQSKSSCCSQFYPQLARSFKRLTISFGNQFS